MDELSAVIGNGKLSSKGLVRWIEREIASGFNDQFLVEVGSGGHGDDREVQPTGNPVSYLNSSTLSNLPLTGLSFYFGLGLATDCNFLLWNEYELFCALV